MYNLAMSARPLPKGAILVPKTAKLVFHGEIFDTYQWDQKMYDGSISTFEMLKRPDTVVILGVVDGKVVLEEQEQPNKPVHFTLPAGRVEPNEDVLEAAKREMAEETGMSFNKWELKDVHQPFVKMDWFIYTYVATNLNERNEQNLDAGEKIRIDLVDYQRVVELIKEGHMHWSAYLTKQILNGKDRLEDILNAPNFKEDQDE
jgi:ADP-ribose pyrophosphatase